jgi:hypothetical protein
VVADKLPLTLDRKGRAGCVARAAGPRSPQELLLEAPTPTPTARCRPCAARTLWPAAVVPGIKTEGWVASGQTLRLQALALDTEASPGRRAAGGAAVARLTTTSRKRMVGGFYTYDNQTAARTWAPCAPAPATRAACCCASHAARGRRGRAGGHRQGRPGPQAQAAGSVWVTRQGELWFGGDNHDRIDVLPEKKSYQPGETARCRCACRFATPRPWWRSSARASAPEVVQLNGQDPTVQLKMPGWGPNVYVSVLALRGRLREVPWYSFFTWGFKAPREWWRPSGTRARIRGAHGAGGPQQARLPPGPGRAARGHGRRTDRREGEADKPSYPVRGKAQVTISATLPDGKPAANAEVALAAVDQACWS